MSIDPEAVMAPDRADVPLVSVVIPTRNRPEYLAEALRALRAGDARAFEAWIMDQSDGDETQRVVEALGDPRLHYYRMPRLGACPARNLGAALGRADIIAFLDDDCSPNDDWISRIVASFAADSELQFIFGQLKAPPHDAKLGSYPEFLPELSVNQGGSRRSIVTYAAGANMSARKSFLRRIGGFDELLGPGVPGVKSNDSSMNYKVFRSGTKWIASDEIEVIHTHGFRPYGHLGTLLREYAHGLGVNYGRFARRGDLYAVWCFVLEQGEMIRGTAVALVRERRPRGLRNWLAHLRGFFDGLRLNGRVGYVDGAELRRMEETRQLDP